jgi:hypothetical protein
MAFSAPSPLRTLSADQVSLGLGPRVIASVFSAIDLSRIQSKTPRCDRRTDGFRAVASGSVMTVRSAEREMGDGEWRSQRQRAPDGDPEVVQWFDPEDEIRRESQRSEPREFGLQRLSNSYAVGEWTSWEVRIPGLLVGGRVWSIVRRDGLKYPKSAPSVAGHYVVDQR